ncbi:winged helix-turn-helix domain-containing protein [Lysobacter brunescens]|uniref:Winged helix-turn-helix domain-containing protein n=1 Tax=Lysobacter brunescens TaxID=262323 RepID=A0ABW2YCE9_9GAMM
MNSNQPSPAPGPRPAGYAIGDLLVEPHLRRVRRPEGDIELTQRVFDLLQAFIDAPFVLHSREALFQRVWGTLHIEDTNLTQNISILRKALGDERKHWIRTVSRTGYCFEPPHEIEIVQDARDLAARPLGQAAATAAQDAGPDEAPSAPSTETPAPTAAPPYRASPLRIAAAVLIAMASLLVPSASPKTLAVDATLATTGLSIGIVLTQTDLARNDTEREATRLLREWVRWKLSRLPAVILIEEQHLISGRPIPGYYLDMNVVVSPDAPTQHVFEFAFRPIYDVAPAGGGSPDEGPAADYAHRLVLEGNAARLPAMVDRASNDILRRILPQRRNDHWPALAMDTEAAHRFAAAAAATRRQAPEALRLLEAAVRSAPEFGPARLLLASELAERRHYRQASEQAQLALTHTAPMPVDAAMLVTAEADALIPSRSAEALKLYRQFHLANPSRMEFLFRQALIHQWNLRPEDAYELLSLDEWERETGPLQIRRLVARADAAFLLGYLHQSDNSATEAISRIEGGQGGSLADLAMAKYLSARVAAQLYAQDDPGTPFTEVASLFDRAAHDYQASIARYYEAVFRDDLRLIEQRLAQSVELAQSYGDPLNEVWPQRMIGPHYLWSGHREKSRAALETGVSAASRAGALPLRDLLEMDLVIMAIEDLDMQESIQRTERLRNNHLWTKYRYRSANFASQVLALRGRYREALSVLDASLGDESRAQRWDMPKSELSLTACTRMSALLFTGAGAAAIAQSQSCGDDVLVAFTSAQIALLGRDTEAARRHLQEARKEIDSPPEDGTDIVELAGLASLLIRLGDVDAARRALEETRTGDVGVIDTRTQVEVDLAWAELSAANGDWATAQRQADALRARIPAEALHYLNRLALLDIARLQAQGEREEARKRASELDETARRNGDAVTRAELQRISGGIFGTTLGLNK